MKKYVRIFALAFGSDERMSELLTARIESAAEGLGITRETLMAQFNVVAIQFGGNGQLVVVVEFFVEPAKPS